MPDASSLWLESVFSKIVAKKKRIFTDSSENREDMIASINMVLALFDHPH